MLFFFHGKSLFTLYGAPGQCLRYHIANELLLANSQDLPSNVGCLKTRSDLGLLKTFLHMTLWRLRLPPACFLTTSISSAMGRQLLDPGKYKTGSWLQNASKAFPDVNITLLHLLLYLLVVLPKN